MTRPLPRRPSPPPSPVHGDVRRHDQPGDLVGIGVHHTGYSYLVKPGDTLASVAAYYGTLFNVTPNGPSVTVPTNYSVTAQSVAMASSSQDVRRTERGFTIAIWAYDYPSRDAAGSAIDAALANTPFLAMPDGSVARLRFGNAFSSDHPENAQLFTRDLIYMTEYSTLAINQAARALFVGTGITRVIGLGPDYNPDAVAGQLYPPIELDSQGQPVLDGNGAQVFQSFDL